MVWRSRVIGTRSSRSSSEAGAGDGGGDGAGAGGLRDKIENIAFEDLAALAGPLHGGRIEAMISGDLCGGGRGGHC